MDLPWTDVSFVEHWDDLAKAHWLYSPTKQIFWTCDTPESLTVKADYVRFFNLGGLMFWEVSGDLDGELITALHHGLKVADPPETNPCS